MLSTIASPAFSRVTILYGDDHFRGIELRFPGRGAFLGLSQAERAEEVTRNRKRLEVFREARKVRDFELKLCVCTWGSVGQEPVWILEEKKRKMGLVIFSQIRGWSTARSGPVLAIKSTVLRGRIRACPSLSPRCNNYITTEIQLESQCELGEKNRASGSSR